MNPMDDYGDDLLDTETLYLETTAGMPSLFEGSTESQPYSLSAFIFDNNSGLQSSQGFQVFGLDVDSECQITSPRRDLPPQASQVTRQPVYRPSETTQSSFQTIDDHVSLSNPTPHLNQKGYTALIFTEASSHFNPVRAPVVKPSPREIRPHPGQMVTEECSAEVFDDSCEGASSDEKSEEHKVSPKRRGRKSGSTSYVTKELVAGAVKMEEGEVQAGPDLSFKPSLEEILSEKKMALLRSPQVVKFMKHFQQKARLEKMQHQSTMKES